MNRNGPEPTISVTGLLMSEFASRSGMMKQAKATGCASASGRMPNGFFSRKRIVLSSGAEISSAWRSSDVPNASRTLHRLMLAMQSRANTGSPSWNFNPGRSLIFHVRLSSEIVWPSAICGLARYFESTLYNVSNT
jgi:hypothetical protein